MGCDIHSFVEVKKGDHWEMVGEIFPLHGFDLERSLSRGKGTHSKHPFDHRSYGMFGFLANVRNYSHVPCIQEPTYELPADASDGVKEEYGNDSDSHSLNVLTLRRLAEYDYGQMFWDRRVTPLADEGEGETVKLGDFLGEEFFEQIEIMKTLGNLDDVRVIFWFGD